MPNERGCGDYMDMGIIWLLGIIAFLIIEGLTYQMVSIYLAIGAVAGLITYLLDFGYMPQMIVFLAVSIICILLLRPVSLKLIKNKKLKTNTDSLIGEKIKITETVNNINGSGRGFVNGLSWKVRSSDDSVINEGDVAVIENIEGVKLIVKGEK